MYKPLRYLVITVIMGHLVYKRKQTALEAHTIHVVGKSIIIYIRSISLKIYILFRNIKTRR